MDAGTIASDIVTVSGNRQAVQHRNGSIVTALHVTEGQLVKQGDLLATISATQLVASEREMTSHYVKLLALRARLQAELGGQAEVITPADFGALAPAGRDIRRQRALFLARRNALSAQRRTSS
jgi:multidrug efflux pump subunit AcrA (membrane-fusion protein)